jgi:transmembrane sensor
MDAIAARALLARYLEGNANQEEMIIIEQWYRQMEEEGAWTWAEGEREDMEALLEGRLLREIGGGRADAGPLAGEPADVSAGADPGTRMPVYRRMARWAVAAVVLAAIAAVWLFVVRRGPGGLAPVAQRYRNDVLPGHNAAVLTLAGGRTVVLDASAPKDIGRQGNTEVFNDDGRLVYQAEAAATPGAGTGKAAEIFYNTLTTHKGNQYHLTLPDGTGVWLNAVSSITYPTAFTGKERRVTISGEAYFEVMKNQQQPFIVQEGGMSVQVLGTSFDVNGYGDGAVLRTTLVEGKVRVGKGAAGNVLEPGQQAVIPNGAGAISIDHNPDIDAVLAWKNGTFAFKDDGITAIMQQVQRWYDVEVIYEANITKHFVAEIPRNVPLSQLLQLLEATDQVHFRVEGKKIFVMP